MNTDYFASVSDISKIYSKAMEKNTVITTLLLLLHKVENNQKQQKF